MNAALHIVGQHNAVIILQWLVAAQFVKNFGSVGVVAMLIFGLGNSDFAFCANS